MIDEGNELVSVTKFFMEFIYDNFNFSHFLMIICYFYQFNITSVMSFMKILGTLIVDGDLSRRKGGFSTSACQSLGWLFLFFLFGCFAHSLSILAVCVQRRMRQQLVS